MSKHDDLLKRAEALTYEQRQKIALDVADMLDRVVVGPASVSASSYEALGRLFFLRRVDVLILASYALLMMQELPKEKARLRLADEAIIALTSHVSPTQQRKWGSREAVRAYRNSLPPLPIPELKGGVV